ncbi:protein kinase [Microtetraspora sp. AC03309]|uniref:serine/threonine-protein kinase n=1 Tax=Microtetraspora sp. AC03309 TaxID=2779376 RepID=UPI001E4ABE2D|nr:serine/threonine-protein kinase [Microtetraspora sp. AC03309]MCC5577975.1 protein kinase [Microtetraspora sp. AC03309]
MTSGTLMAEDPARLGDYWIAGRLGAGGQGVVYEAYGPDGRRVAIKVLHGDAAEDDDLRRRFGREAEAARRVASFCTAQVIDAVLDGPRPYIVSEYVEGVSLRQAVGEGRRFAGDELHRLATAVATAVAAIHDAGVIHRDLKPDNVLLGPDGPRVIDFGVARTLEMSLTATGLVAGTPTYMAPEVFVGERAGPPADLFAWGGIVLFAATGTDPFTAESLGGVMHRVLSEDPELGVLPRSLRPLVSAALAKDPKARPAARELLHGLISGTHGADSGDLLALGSAEAGLLTVPGPGDPGLGMLAEDGYGMLTAAERELVPEVFLRLATVTDDGEVVARRAPRAELVDGRPEDEAASVARIIEVFAYVLAERDGEIGLSRPALIQAWPRFRAWVQAEREGLAVLREITVAARRWNHGGDGDLLQGDRLDTVLRWAATGRRHLTLSRLERDFLDAGSALARRRAGRRRAVTVALAALLVLAIGFGAATVRQSAVVGEQRDLAESRGVASLADRLRETDPVKAMLLSVAAWRLGDTAEARGSLVTSLSQREQGVLRLKGSAHTLSGDGRTAVSVDGDGVSVWDVPSGRRTGGWSGLGVRGRRLHSIALSGDGRLLAVAAGTWVRVWDVRTGKATGKSLPLDAGEYEPHYPIEVAFGASPRVLVIGFSGMVRVWDLDTGAASPKRPGYLADVDPAGRIAAIDGVGERPLLFDLPGATRRRTPPGVCGTGPPTPTDDGIGPQALAFSPDGRTLACVADEGITLTDLAQGKTGEPFGPAATGQPAVTFSADGRFLAVRGEDAVRVWRVADHAPLLVHPTLGEAAQVRFDRDGGALRYVLDDTVHTVDIADLARPATAGPANEGAVLTPDGRFAAGDANGSGAVTLRDTRTGRAAGAAIAVTESVQQVAFSHDARIVAVADDAGSRAWVTDRRSGRTLATTTVRDAANSSILGVAVSPDGTRAAAAMVTSATSAEIHVADLSTGKWRIAAKIPDGGASRMVFSPDGRLLAVLGQDAGHLVDVAAGEARSFAATGQTLTAVAFHPRDPIVVTLDGAGRVIAWDTRSGERHGPVLRTERNAVGAMAFTADGALLATGAGREVRLWDIGSGTAIGEPIGTHGADVVSVAFGPGATADPGGSAGSGEPVLTSLDAGGAVRARPVTPDAVAAAVCARAGRTLSKDEWRDHLPGLPYEDVCARTS